MGCALAGAALATLVLAGCTPDADAPLEDPSAATASSEVEAAVIAEADCTRPAWIELTPESATITGVVEDQGEREFARGTADVMEDGKITYTVAPGDVDAVIGERFCIKNGGTISALNHTRTIHPDQVLRLYANPHIRFIDYYIPHDAPEGFLQIPYQNAIEAMGAAADADDIEAMRAIWADTLAGMFTDPAETAAIERALDAGDIDVLQQMFS